MKILYTSAEVHDAIKALLSSPAIRERRVILVAYIGKSAAAKVNPAFAFAPSSVHSTLPILSDRITFTSLTGTLPTVKPSLSTLVAPDSIDATIPPANTEMVYVPG